MAKFTLTGTVKDHKEDPVGRARIRAVPTPGVSTDGGSVYVGDSVQMYTDMTGQFAMDLVTAPGLAYDVFISVGDANVPTKTITFAAGAAGSSLDLATVTPQNQNLPDSVLGYQMLLDQIRAQQRLQLGLAAAL